MWDKYIFCPQRGTKQSPSGAVASSFLLAADIVYLILRNYLGISARNIDILGGSRIAAGVGKELTKESDRPGDITLNTTGSVTIDRVSRLANVVAEDASGNAGNINIRAGEIFITNLASKPALDSRNLGWGSGGNVSLEANGSIYLFGQDEKAGDKVISSRSTLCYSETRFGDRRSQRFWLQFSELAKLA